jgi:hypothetical protein
MKTEVKDKNLKNYNSHLTTFFIINLVIFILIISNELLDLPHFNAIYEKITVKDSVIVVGTPLIIFILNYVIPSDFKYILVFWRLKYPLPGTRIFSKLAVNDCRLDLNILAKAYGSLPTDPKQQNTLWYKIYSKHMYHPMIFQSHRDFLLSRDLTSLSCLFLVAYTSSLLVIVNDSTTIRWYVMLLLLQYIVLSHVSRSLGNRFACNVLALDSNYVES